MDFDELVASRRSIRKYKPNCSISIDVVNTLIETAKQAPSWKNSQTGRYYVALSDEAREKVYNALPSFNQNNSTNACAYIICAYEMNHSGFNVDKTPTNELGNKWGTFDLGLQVELLILKAKELGLDTLIMGIRDASLLKKEFGIPENEEIVSIISLGYRDIDPNKPQRKDLYEILKIY